MPRRHQRTSSASRTVLTNKLKCIVVVHGKSEQQIVSYIRQTYRMKMEIYANNGGTNSIQITSLIKFLNAQLKSYDEFLDKFEDDLDVRGRGRSKVINNFKIFTIMDTDDCSHIQATAYMNGQMFKGNWYEDYIEPIYNQPNLENMFIRGKFPYEINDRNKGESYLKTFPPADPATTKEETVGHLKQASISSGVSNFHSLIEFCEANRSSF